MNCSSRHDCMPRCTYCIPVAQSRILISCLGWPCLHSQHDTCPVLIGFTPSGLVCIRVCCLHAGPSCDICVYLLALLVTSVCVCQPIRRIEPEHGRSRVYAQWLDKEDDLQAAIGELSVFGSRALAL